MRELAFVPVLARTALPVPADDLRLRLRVDTMDVALTFTLLERVRLQQPVLLDLTVLESALDGRVETFIAT